MNKDFSISEAISFGWQTFKSNWKFWIVVTLLIGVGRMGGGLGSIRNSFDKFNSNEITQQITQKNSNLIAFKGLNKSVLGTTTENASKNLDTGAIIVVGIIVTVVAIFAFIVTMLTILAGVIFRMGHINLLLDAARSNELYYKTLLNQVSFKKAFRFLSASALAGVIIFFGYMFFIIPGILFTLKYMFVPFVVVDEDPGVRKALKRSSQLTKGVRFKLFLFILAMLGLSIVGLLALGVGLYVVSIVGALAFAYIYVKVLEQEATPELSEVSNQ